MAEAKKYTCPHCGELHSRSTDRCPTEDKPIPESFKLEGEVLDKKYRLDRRLAEGGMGVVYEGTHLTIGRKLAVKVLHSEINAHDDVVARFHNEAKIAAAIGHRNIVDIIDMGKFRRKFYFIVMEFLEGQDLRALLQRRHRLSVKEAVDIAMQVLSGLKAAHVKGIIHRDLKPENVFIVREPGGEQYIKLLDFGVSRLVDREGDADVRLTLSGMVFGTPRYIPPEQAKGKSTLDHRADLYSLGAILYESITGRPLFLSSNYNELMVEILTQDPAPADEAAEGVPRELSDAIMKAVSKRPEARFQTAEAFMRALAPFSSAPTYMTETFTHLSLKVPEGQGGRESTPAGTRPEQVVLRALKRMDTLPPVAGASQTDGSSGISRTGAEISTLRPRESRVFVIGRRSFIIFVVPVIFVLVVAALVATILVYKSNVSTPSQAGAVKWKDSGANEEPGEGAGGNFARISIENLPDGAKVFVDDVLHPERPVLVDKSLESRRIKIMDSGGTLFEEKIVVLDDVSLSLEAGSGSGAGQGGASPETTGKPTKKGSGKKGKGKSKQEIDESYPIGM